MSTNKAKGFLNEFKTFAMRGNVIDLAVGVVIGGAFGKITTSIVNDIIMPIIGVLTGGLNFSDWKIVLKQAVLEAGEVVTPEVAITFGNTIAVIVDFIIIAFAVFCMVKGINTMRAKAEELKKKEEEAVEEPAAPAEPPAPPAPTAEDLLTEIRDLLKNK